MLELIFIFSFLFVPQDTPLEKLDKKHFAKASRGAEQNGVAATLKEFDNLKVIALMEAKMKKLCDLLGEVSFLACVTTIFNSCFVEEFFLRLWSY